MHNLSTHVDGACNIDYCIGITKAISTPYARLNMLTRVSLSEQGFDKSLKPAKLRQCFWFTVVHFLECSSNASTMYLRSIHAESSIPALRAFMLENPLGILTTAIQSSGFPLIQSTHIPWVVDIEDDTDETQLPRIRGHVARQNPQAKAIIQHVGQSSSSILKEEVMVLFNGPAHHYITPKFYAETKPATGKVVPTWNYSAVQAYGTATVYVDSKAPETTAFLSKQIRDLSYMAETSIMGYSKPWSVDDAPPNYISLLSKNIIGIEIEIHSLGGKHKMSQESPEGDRMGVVEGLRSLGTEVGSTVASVVQERGAR